MNTYVIVYHYPCTDGSTAELVVRQALFARDPDSKVVSIPAIHNKDINSFSIPEDLRGASVIVVDFGLPMSVLQEIARHSKILVLDHHKSTQDAYADFDLPKNVEFVFDMNKSGAGLAWGYFNPDKTPPWYIDYVQDHDLFLNELSQTEEVSAFIQSFPLDRIERAFTAGLSEAKLVGHHLLAQRKELAANIAKTAVVVDLGAIMAHVVNVGFPLAQIVLHHLLRQNECQISIGYFRVGGAWKLAVRSAEASPVTALDFCKQFGGGGHIHAAGATVSRLEDVFPTF